MIVLGRSGCMQAVSEFLQAVWKNQMLAEKNQMAVGDHGFSFLSMNKPEQASLAPLGLTETFRWFCE